MKKSINRPLKASPTSRADQLISQIKKTWQLGADRSVEGVLDRALLGLKMVALYVSVFLMIGILPRMISMLFSVEIPEWQQALMTTLISASFAAVLIFRFRELFRVQLKATGEILSSLQKSEAESRKLSLVASHTDSSVVICDISGKIEWVNRAFCKLTEYSFREVVGKRLPELLQGPESVSETIAHIHSRMERGEQIKAEVLQYTKSRRRRWFSVEVNALFNENRELVNFVVIQADITDRRRINDELEKARQVAEDASKAKGEFLATMSHEIRTPLNGIIGMVNFLLASELTPRARNFAELAKRSANLLANIVNDILDFSKIEAGKLELEEMDFNLPGAVNQTVEVLVDRATSKGLKLDSFFAPDLPIYVRGDANRLQQIIINLINNAIKFTKEGGISLTAKRLPAESGRALIRFEVIDTGIGISKEASVRLFQSFSQVDASTTRVFGGTGLGLAICKQLTTLMGGEIGVYSELGRGSTFWFTVNLAEQLQSRIVPQESNQAKVSSELNEQGDICVLFAEDNEINQVVTSEILRSLGLRFEIASNGQEALDATVNKRYDLILMDCQMPIMDGFEATHLIRERERAAENRGEKIPRVPIVAITANAIKGDKERCLDAGMDDYVVKPIDTEKLVAVVKQYVGSKVSSKTEATPNSNSDSFGIPTPQDLEGPVDLNGLSARCMNNNELITMVVLKFKEQAPRDVDNLKQSLQNQDAKTFASIAHALKGAAQMVGALNLSEYAKQLEQLGRAGNLEEANATMDRLANEVTTCVEFLGGASS